MQDADTSAVLRATVWLLNNGYLVFQNLDLTASPQLAAWHSDIGKPFLVQVVVLEDGMVATAEPDIRVLAVSLTTDEAMFLGG